MLPTPEQYASTDPAELLDAAARGYLPVDHRLLHALLDDPARTLPSLARFAENYQPSDEFDLSPLLVDLFAYLPDPRALPFLVRQARESEEYSDELTEAFVRIGPPAVEPLLELRSQLDAAGEVDFLLASLGVRDDRITDLLVALLDSNDPTNAAFLLGVYGHPAARAALEEAMRRHPEAEDAFQAALSSLDDNPPSRVDDEPFPIWSHYPEEAQPDWGPLPEREKLSFLASESPLHRLWAADGFTGEEFSDAAAEILLRHAKTDSSENVRAACWAALAACVDDSSVLEAMRERVAAPGLPLAEFAALALALAPADSEDPKVREGILAAYADPDTRHIAIEAMWSTLDPDYAPYIEKHLDDEDAAVRRQALIGAGYLRLTGLAARLEDVFDDPDFREEALFAYALAAPGDTTAAGVRKLLARIDELAGGLDEDDDAFVVKQGLDLRLQMAGKRPVFSASTEEEETPPAASPPKVGRNDPCPCGSGKKFKKCHGAA